MSEYRLIALDVDGTILNPVGQLSPRVIAAVQAAQARGVTVALATARRWTGAAPIARALGLRGPLILYDGALRRLSPGGAIELALPLAKDIALEVARRMVAGGVRAVAQYSPLAGERMVASVELPMGGWMEPYLDTFAHQVRYRPVAALLGRRAPLRLVSFAPLERLRPLAEQMADLKAEWQILESGSYGQAELTLFAPDVSKGAALTQLATDLRIPLAETLALGDGVNDISMLRAAGLGVAMGNAAAPARLAADVVTASNAEDGAARAIERYVLGEPGEPGEPGEAEELTEEPA